MAQQPPAAPPPAAPPPPGTPGYGPAPGPGSAGPRPPGVMPAAVMLIITGVLWALFGAIMMIGGGAAVDVIGAGGGVVIVIGLLVLAMGVFDIIAGVKVLGLNAGWRVGGIILTAVGTLISLLLLIGGFQGTETLEIDPNTFEFTTVSQTNVGGIIFALVFLAANVVSLILLARNSSAYARR